MVFLRREGDEGGRRLSHGPVYLRHPEAQDFQQWSALRAKSRAFLEPWEPTWPEDDLTLSAFRFKLRRYAHDIRDGRSYPLYVFRVSDNQLIGGLTLSQVRRGAAQSGTIGYWIGEQYQGQGYTTAAVRAVIQFAFEDLWLHRLEAACQPDNLASQAVLRKAGFVEEGRARAYLKINGAWRDHILFGLVTGEQV